MMPKKQIPVTIVGILCIFVFSSCQTVPTKASGIDGSYLGRDIDECYEAWGVTPGEDALKMYGESWINIFLTRPVEYLGETFYVRITYPTGYKKIYNNRLDSIVYFKDFYRFTDEKVAKKASELFAALQKEYGTLGEIHIVQSKYTQDGINQTVGSKTADASAIQKDKIIEEMKKSSLSGNSLSLLYDLSLPEELDKLDFDYVKALENYDNRKRTYKVIGNLEYVEGRYIFSVTHKIGQWMDVA